MLTKQEYKQVLLRKSTHKHRKEDNIMTLWDLTTYLETSHPRAIATFYKLFGAREAYTITIKVESYPSVSINTVVIRNKQELKKIWAKLDNVHMSRLDKLFSSF